MKMSLYYKENVVKDLFLLSVAALFWPSINGTISATQITDLEALLGLFGLLIVFSGAVNFAFTYENVNMKRPTQRLTAHITTFLAQLTLLILLETLISIVKFHFTPLYHLTLFIGILSALVVILYDFWDLEKNSDV